MPHIADQFDLFQPDEIPVLAETRVLSAREVWQRRHKVGLVGFVDPAFSHDPDAEPLDWFAYDDRYEVGPEDEADADRWVREGWAVCAATEFQALADYARAHGLPWPC